MISIFRTKQADQQSWVESHPEFGKIHFSINRRARTLRLSVKPFEGLQLTIPSRFPKGDIPLFLKNKRIWIRKALDRAHRTESKSREFFTSSPVVADSIIRNTLSKRLESVAKQFGFSYNKVSLRNQKSRWASCSSENNISLNRKLYFLPEDLCNYVLLHELAHTLEKNHGPDFWKILYDILGKQVTHQRRQALKDFEFLFHPPPIEQQGSNSN